MSFTILCTVVLAFYGILFFFDSFFKSCMHYPYYAFLKGTGFKVGLFNFSWTTTAFNRIIYRWGNTSRFFMKWFKYGSILTLSFFLPFSLWTLLSVAVKHFLVQEADPNSITTVTAVLPGVNLPMSDFWVYFFALATCSIFHELGHAIAAVQEDVQLLSVGVHVFAIIPLAFVQLNTEHLNSLTIGKQLRIYCAGVWHNIATASLALLLFFGTPNIFNVAYKTNVGVRVTDIEYNSPLKGERGLEVGDLIVAVNGCNVNNYPSWKECLMLAHNRFGICTSSQHIAQHDEVMQERWKENNVVECCRSEDTHSFCFEYMEPQLVEAALAGQFSCLKPRDMVGDKLTKCTLAEEYRCPVDHHCLKPSLGNNTYFIVIQREQKKPVLYLGLSYHVHSTVSVDQYLPRSSFFNYFSPKQFEKVMHFLFIFSMGIGFLNIIPCYGADGHHIARNLIQLMANYLQKNGEFVTVCTMITIIAGTLITWPTLMFLFYKEIKQSFLSD